MNNRFRNQTSCNNMNLTSNNSAVINDTCKITGAINSTRDDYEIVDRIVPGLWGALITLGLLDNGFVVYVMLR